MRPSGENGEKALRAGQAAGVEFHLMQLRGDLVVRLHELVVLGGHLAELVDQIGAGGGVEDDVAEPEDPQSGKAQESEGGDENGNSLKYFSLHG